MAEEKTIFLGAKLREPFPLPHQITGYALSTIPGCFEVWGIKDPEIELTKLREERDLAMEAARRGRNLAELVCRETNKEVLVDQARKLLDYWKGDSD